MRIINQTRQMSNNDAPNYRFMIEKSSNFIYDASMQKYNIELKYSQS